jgi:hypothetical protein
MKPKTLLWLGGVLAIPVRTYFTFIYAGAGPKLRSDDKGRLKLGR